MFVNSFSFKNCDHYRVIPPFALTLGGHLHGVKQDGDGSGPQALIDVHPFDRSDDLEFALVGHQAMPDHAFAIGEFFLMHRMTTAALVDSKLPKMGFHGRRAAPQEGGDFLRWKALDEVFLLEKTLVDILWK